jgi:hypothetical protein
MPKLNHSTLARHQTSLEEFIAELIGKLMGIKPEEVTTEFIHIWREKEFYPTAHFEPTAAYVPGQNGRRRMALTGNELLDQSDRAKAFFKTLNNGTNGNK